LDSLPKDVMEGKTEGTGRGGRRCKRLLDDLQEKIRYWDLKRMH
jgi:hypothetical protein